MTVLLATALAAAPLALVARAESRRRLGEEVQDAVGSLRLLESAAGVGKAVLALGGSAVLVAAFRRAMVVDGRGISTASDHNLGDLPFHLNLIAGFVWGGNVPPEHPELAGVGLTYPFLVDFGAALLVAAGSEVHTALLVQNVVLALALFALLHALGRDLAGSPTAGFLTAGLVFLSGGLGFVTLFQDGAPWPEALTERRLDVTIGAPGLRWPNAVISLLIPQRAFLQGLPLVVLAWRLILTGPATSRTFVGAGLVAGLLPLAHAHGFVTAAGSLVLLALARHGLRAAVAAGGATTLAGLPQVLFLAVGSGMKGGGFLGWHLGWDRGEAGVVAFWLYNAGLFLPLWAAGLAARRGSWRDGAPLLALVMVPWFVVPNVLRLSPWVWDNVKFLFHGWVGAAPLVAWTVVRLGSGPPWRRAAAAAVGVVLLASGALDVVRLVGRRTPHLVYTADAVEAGQLVREATSPRAVLLHAPTYNSPVYLAGRRSFLGYTGHIWSQGYDGGSREALLDAYYGGDPSAAAALRAAGVDYVLVGPQEVERSGVREAPPGAELVASRAGHALFRLR